MTSTSGGKVQLRDECLRSQCGSISASAISRLDVRNQQKELQYPRPIQNRGIHVPIFKPGSDKYLRLDADGKKLKLLSQAAYDQFNSSLLGLGDIRTASKPTDAIAAIFDLEGFTTFSKQIEPHLSVPLFLNEFLEWLFAAIKSEMTERNYKEGARLYCELPFFVKFMGDGLLILWDASNSTGSVDHENIVISASEICDRYVDQFLPTIRRKVSSPPPRLRCGLARGTVYSVGNGNDFVGSCINMAARLQKLPGLTFAFNRRGFDLESAEVSSFFKQGIVVKRVTVRGIGDDELVGVLINEFESLDALDKDQFRDP
jgi:class 3 adenylate cyclase